MGASLKGISADNIKASLGNPDDLNVRSITLNLLMENRLECSIVFIAGIADEKEIENFIIKPLQQLSPAVEIKDILLTVQKEIIQAKSIATLHLYKDAIHDLLNGKTIVIIEGINDVLSIDVAKWKERSLTEAEGQRVTKGPLIGFNENLATNIAIMRHAIKNEQLRLENYTFGSLTNTNICIIYLEQSVDKTILAELKKRLTKIKSSKILDANYVEEYIRDQFLTPFPLILTTDRPDVLTGEITDGKIAILVEGTPYALVIPALFLQFLQSPDDYYFVNGGVTRLLRILALTLAIYLPAFYLAFVTYHPGLLPFDLILSLASQREGKPLPLVVELLLFMFLFQIIIEGALRLPKGLVSVVSIVGTIIIGQSAVEAGLVQPATLLVVSMSYIFSFVAPIMTLATAVRTLRYGFILIAAFLGLYGIILATLALVFHLNHLRSFGVPYFSPLFPFNPKDQKDTIYRFPLRKLTNKHQFQHEEPVPKKRE